MSTNATDTATIEDLRKIVETADRLLIGLVHTPTPDARAARSTNLIRDAVSSAQRISANALIGKHTSSELQFALHLAKRQIANVNDLLGFCAFERADSPSAERH